MAPFELRWGILATGWIAEQFVTDLCTDPSIRGQAIKHTVTAAASSRSAAQASQFLQTQSWPDAKAYGSYAELVNDSNVDVIYIATPHSHHYQNAMLCLEAGKHVLCEKSFTVNAAQTERLVSVAREKGLFLMEAVWTRFFPMSVRIRDIIREGGLGAVYRTMADLSMGGDVEEKFGREHRVVNMDLAGGALLDLGIYSLTWVFQTLYHTLPVDARKTPSVVAQMHKYAATGVDEDTSILLSFSSGPSGANYSQGIATTSLRVGPTASSKETVNPAIRIQGTKAEIQVDHPAFRPSRWRLVHEDGKVEEFENEMPDGVRGFAYEADEVARCVRDGKKESELLSLDESIVIMRVMDEVRRQGDLKYPDKLETLDYPIEHW